LKDEITAIKNGVQGESIGERELSSKEQVQCQNISQAFMRVMF
jgi:hypothetical protein